jgi:hypothetical protein
MFLAHSFRLRRPWQCDCLTTGATRWSRVFHRPTGLEHDDALWLVCAGLPAEARVILNGVELPQVESSQDTASGQTPSSCATGVPPVQPTERWPIGDDLAHSERSQKHQYEVTALLADTNKVELLIPAGSPPSLPTAHCPPPTPFPYDLRLGVIGHS